jgi:signal transduction histidine kinase
VTDKNGGPSLGLAVQHLEESLGDVWLAAELLNQHHDDLRPVKRAEYLDFISSKAASLSRLVADLVQLSSLETHSATLNCTPLHVSELVMEGMEALQTQADGRSVAVCLVCSGIEANVQGDYWKLSQAIHALLEDAVRCTSPGGRVDIEVRSMPRAVRIVIRSSEVIKSGQRMGLSSFTPSACSKAETCLTFPLAKELVDLHGGLLSGIPGGKQFVVVLPAAA